MASQFFDMKSSSSCLDAVLFLLPKLVTGPSFMSIFSVALESYDNFLYKGLTRSLEIGNTPVYILPNIWRLGQVKYTKFLSQMNE